jgi:acetylornithine deacetylase/succinyl-diaminopimelate desuccinylase-like protein
VPVALALAERLRALPLTARDDRFDPPTSTLALTRLAAGDPTAPNVVPDQVVIGIDRRLLPAEDADAAVDDLRQATAAVVEPPFGWDLGLQRQWPAYAIEPDDQVAVLARDAVRACGREPAIGMDSAANDASWLQRSGVETVLLGPGDPAQAHVSDEWVSAAELADAIRVYAQIGAATATGSAR